MKRTKLHYRPGALASQSAIRLEASKVYRDARNAELDPAIGSRLIGLLAVIAKLLENSDFETRLQAIEEALEEAQQMPPRDGLPLHDAIN